jgi:NAD-dependent dihydropyrimidine dehydrogenase PreA subunit
MAYIITDPCIGTKDTACVDVCPVDCIHPRKDEPEFKESPMLFINPEECIDCGACIPVCPVNAIYAHEAPLSQAKLVEANRAYFDNIDGTAGVAKALALVKEHVNSQPVIMNLPASERAAKH